MGAKRASRKRQTSTNNYTNVVEFNTYQKQQSVTIIPRNKNQETYVLKLLDESKDIVFGIGPAGTGKTLLACQVAVKLFKAGTVDKIIVTRPAVSADEDLGFLPGTLEQKMAPWTRPIFDVLREYFNAKEIEGMIEEGIIEIAPLAYMRGRTINDSFIILDEAQNTTKEQMKMFLTRIGFNTTAVITGDITQVDLPRNITSGLKDALSILVDINGIGINYLQSVDIVRHEIVQKIVTAYDKAFNKQEKNKNG
jgi:phosphate starvation-inducible PhoH-like protein